MTGLELKTIVINNYKEELKARRALHDLEHCTSQTLEMVDYKTPNLHEQILGKSPDLVILTGSNFMLSKPDTRMVFQQEMDLVRKLSLPILGICFGHQLIGSAYGSRVGDLDVPVKDFKEVKILKRHPVFDGLPETIRVSESHHQELKEVPKGFNLLAESATSKFESICHETRPVYSFQFHPERSDEEYPHGRMIIQNVLKLAAKC